MLWENAIRAYEESELWNIDLKKNEEAANRIKKYLSNFGVNKDISSDSVMVESIRFVHQLHYNEDDVYAYEIIASRSCSHCGEHLPLTVLEAGIEDEEATEFVNPSEFGQWLSETHHCEYLSDDKTKPQIGFNK